MSLVFSSLEFLLYFLPIFFILYGLTPERYRNVILLAGSLLFYSFGEPRYLLLLLISIVVNYFIGCFFGAKLKYKNANNAKNRIKYHHYMDWRKVILILTVTGNIGVLLFFKLYGDGGAIPLGISFYTFQILSYLFDVYREDIPAEHSFIKIAAYVTMFPQLISGPIVNYGEVSTELNKRRMSWQSVQNGMKLFTLGLAAKTLLADRVGLLWHDIQVRGFESISTPLAWMGAIAYSLKIYFDFYGYSLMAVGLGRMLGFTIPENFRLPYMAKSVREFYRRWHITLGRWFRSYVYIPLGGNRRGEMCTVRNLLIVWALTGLWHGGRGNFLIWSVLIWALIVVERQTAAFCEKRKLLTNSLFGMLQHLYLWIVIPVSWMCFAITDVRQLWVYLGRMFGAAAQYTVLHDDWLKALNNYGALMLISIIACTPIIKRIYYRWKDNFIMNAALAVLFWVCVWRIMVEGNNPFLYFKF